MKREGDRLQLTYRIEGELSQLRIPEPRPPQAADGLWQRTCCEAFVAEKGRDSYVEFNFSASTEWAVYAFSGYRKRIERAAAAQNLGISVRRSESELELTASVMVPGKSLSIGLSAVIEDRTGVLSYWALAHPAAKPDFHHRDSFTLELG